MTNSERIEAYFNNELTEAERQQLVHDMNTDANLKSEFQFQQEVIDGIKAYRKQELIARLDQVKIVSTGNPAWLKTLGITGVVAVATVGTYLWVNQTQLPPEPSLKHKKEQVAEPNKETEATTEKAIDKITPVEETGKENMAKATQKQHEGTTPQASNKEEVSSPAVIIPEISEPETETTANTDVDLTAPKAMSSSAVRLSTSTDVEVKMSKKYKFHYQVKDGGLILYGNFNDSPFEVLEMKTSKGIKSYLYYKGHFYALATDSDKIRPLVAIENQELIAELQKRR